MLPAQLLSAHLEDYCPSIHVNRLNALMQVSKGLLKSQNLSLTAMGRQINLDIATKHKIKKVDRLESNKLLHSELEQIYGGLSAYILKYVTVEHSTTPIIIDLCYVYDNYKIQMLSAEIAARGRSLPIYREVFEAKGLRGRAEKFINTLSKCLPKDTKILIIMDSGFGEDWFKEVEKLGWNWLVRLRGTKTVKLDENSEWISAHNLIPSIQGKAKSYNQAYILKLSNRACRVVTKGPEARVTKKPIKKSRNYNAHSGKHSRQAKEGWLLATNLPLDFNTANIVNYYKKRMQIEESFRDVKSHRYGLGARYAKTDCVHRWGVKMLLAAIAQIVSWVVGIVAHSKNYQRKFQANTVRDKKVFSYFYLGQLIIEHNLLEELAIDYEKLPQIIDLELARQW